MEPAHSEPRGNIVERTWIPEVAVLIGAMVAVGVFIVPRCFSTIWAEESWTGWVAPFATLVSGGQKLYTDGCHLPIPPLPILVLAALGSPSTWLMESAAHYVTGCASLLLVYAGLRLLRFPERLPLLVTLLGLPLHFWWRKIVYYDELPFFFVAASFVIAAGWLRRRERGATASNGWPLALGLTGALGLLAKHNVGLGLVAGSGVFLFVTAPAAARGRWLAWFVVSTAVGVGLLACAISPWVSLSGLMRDVVLAGSETKGGAALMIRILFQFVLQCAIGIGGCALVVLVARGLSGGGPARERVPPAAPLRGPTTVTAVATIFAGASAVAIAWWSPQIMHVPHGGHVVHTLVLGERIARGLVGGAYLVAVASLGLAAISFWRGRPLCSDAGRDDDAAQAGWVLVFPAMMFCLSSGRAFLSATDAHWLFDVLALGTPTDLLYLLGFALGVSAVMRGLGSADDRRTRALLCAGFMVSGFSVWSTFEARITLGRQATETWPEFAFLRGARMRPQSEGMRAIARRVRELAPTTEDSVLLLPEDPQTIALFERPRPALRGGIVFFDQYLDAFVDADFAEVQAHPPAVILIGPEDGLSWGFNMFGEGHDSRGTSRLRRRVENELLPGRYALDGTYAVDLAEKWHVLRLYRLKTPASTGH